VTNAESVLNAHAAIEQATDRELPARFLLHKRIPPGSGLGGASSDAATTLRGIATLYQLDVDLAAIAAQLGADVPFFLKGGRAIAQGRGEQLMQLPDEPAWFGIAWPRIELSTADVYRAWDDVKGEPPNQLRRAAERVEPRLRDIAVTLGPEWQMTGSGSAFFVRCQTQQEAAERVARKELWTAVTRAMRPWA
jgi:4-diphosphocytidyl-2-C-methyl-D-erythritol kinase